MPETPTRRDFLRKTAAAGAALGAMNLPEMMSETAAAAPGYKKAVITGAPDEAKIKELHAAGFDGVEVNLIPGLVTPDDAAKVRKIADDHGFRIHTVLRGWANFNVPEKAQEDFDFTVGTMHAAKGYGCDAILLVPGRVEGLDMPGKWGFSVEFDEDTGHVSRVGDGDPKYDAYKKAHNDAWDAFHTWVPKLIPVAEETGVVVAVENVWNNLFNTPEHFRCLIDSFKSPWIRAYYDVANHMAYGRPAEEWIRVLGDRIAKIHIKDYKIDAGEGEPEWPFLLEGSVNFPEVMKALRKVGYTGWLTIEGSGGLPYDEQNRRLEKIIAMG